eukprot:1219145-Rhodomonas_salina.1
MLEAAEPALLFQHAQQTRIQETAFLYVAGAADEEKQETQSGSAEKVKGGQTEAGAGQAGSKTSGGKEGGGKEA